MRITLNAYLLLASFCYSRKASTPQWHEIFLRGIGCNWLVSIAVWVRTLPLKHFFHITHYTSSSCIFLSTSKLQEHETPFQRCTIDGPTASHSHAYHFLLESLDLRDLDTYLGSLRNYRIFLSLHAHLTERGMYIYVFYTRKINVAHQMTCQSHLVVYS